MTGDSICSEHPAAPTERFGRCLQTAGFALLLAVVATRPFLGEMTFRGSGFREAFAAASTGADQIARYDRSELARVHLGPVLLAGCLLWFIGGAIRDRLAIRYGFLLWAIVVFGVLSFISAQYASDKRAALNGWMEQVSLILAGFVALQICADRRRFAMVMIVLAALGGALAVKGIYQYFVEVPERIADFRMYHAERLAALGWAPETPQARLIRLRTLDKAPFGFFSLANLYASLLVVLLGSGVGLAADKIAHAARGFDQWRRGRKSGEIYTPAIAAVLTVLAACAVAVALVLTRSRGAIGAAAAAAVVGVLVALLGERLARHWRKAVLIVVSVFLLGAALVIACGLKHDRLPTRTMRYRWYYWTGAAEVLADRPVLGAGAGNFHTAYLPHRRPQAEEEVKAPHNVVMHALSQYGLGGGLCYLGVLGFVLVGICRPGCPPAPPSPQGRTSRWRLVVVLPPMLLLLVPIGFSFPVIVPVAVLLAVLLRDRAVALLVAAAPLVGRLVYEYQGGSVPLLVMEVILPVAVFWIILLALLWGGGRLGEALEVPGRFCRIGLACGLGGFALHNMVTYSIWSPGAAVVFWVGAGACLARTGGARPKPTRFGYCPLVYAAAAAVALAALISIPARARISATEQAVDRLRAGNIAEAAELAITAGKADGYDAIAAADAARALLFAAGRTPDDADVKPMIWAEEAVRRDPANYVYWRLQAWIAWDRYYPSFRRYPRIRVGGDKAALATKLRLRLSRDPTDPMLLSDLAGVQYALGAYDEAAKLLGLAIEQDPDAMFLWIRLGDATWRGGKLEKARTAWFQAAQLHRASTDGQTSITSMGRAVALNPQAARNRLDYAELLCAVGNWAESLAQLHAAERIDRALVPNSVERLRGVQIDRLELLRARAGYLLSR